MVAPTRTCPGCGAPAASDALFCITCGRSLAHGTCVDHPGAVPTGTCERCGRFLCAACMALDPPSCASCRGRASPGRSARDRRLARELWLVPCVSYAAIIALAFAAGPGPADSDEVLGVILLGLPLVAGALLASLGQRRLSVWLAAACLGLDLLLMSGLGAASYLPCLLGLLLPAHTLWRAVQLHRLRAPQPLAAAAPGA